MSYQGQTWVDEVALPQLKNGGELLVMLRVANHASNGPKKMSGCYTAAKTLAAECLMGRSTVLNHLRNLTKRELLVPGDPALVEHLPADKRPPVYDLGGAHEAGCPGGHSFIADCEPAGARSEHPQEPLRKKPRSAGVESEHPEARESGAGAQIETERVLKSSTKSSKELKVSLSADASSAAAPADPAEGGGEREEKSSDKPPAPAADDPSAAALQVLAAYEQARGGRAVNGTRQSILRAAEELLAGGRPLHWVIDRARELPQYGTDLIKHAEMSRVPFTAKAASKGPSAREVLGFDDPDFVRVQRDVDGLKAMIARKANI